MHNIWTIKQDKVNNIKVDENIDEMLWDASSPLTKKFLDKGYSLIITNNENAVVCINKDITTKDQETIISTINNIKENNNKVNFHCFNYLDNDEYDSMSRINNNTTDEYFTNICREKLNTLDDNLTKIFKDYREFDLKTSLKGRYSEVPYAPSSFNSGVILVKEDSRIDKSLTKSTHEELIQSLEHTSSHDLYTNKNTTVNIFGGTIKGKSRGILSDEGSVYITNVTSIEAENHGIYNNQGTLVLKKGKIKATVDTGVFSSRIIDFRKYG